MAKLYDFHHELCFSSEREKIKQQVPRRTPYVMKRCSTFVANIDAKYPVNKNMPPVMTTILLVNCLDSAVEPKATIKR